MIQLCAIAGLSAAVLAYEVLLVRLLAIVQWHHFAAMVISLALLGFGASGAALALAQDWLRPRFTFVFATCSALFALSAVAGFALAQAVPFNPLALLWEGRQLLYLLLLELLLLVPFFFGACAIGLAFMALEQAIGRIYAANLLGSGLGALGIVLALFLLSPVTCLWLVAGVALASGALACLAAPPRRALGAAALIVLALLLPLITPPTWTALRISEYKALSMALEVPGTTILDQASSPLGLVTLVESSTIPFRDAPGLSLAAKGEPPRQLGLFVDGEGFSAITDPSGGPSSLAYLGDMTSALPYRLLERPRVLVLGAGGGSDVLQALQLGASQVDAVELDSAVARLVRAAESRFGAGVYQRPEVRLHIADARGFVAASSDSWDLIQMPLIDSLAVAAGGGHGLGESTLYTREAFQDYLAHLRPGGLLAITRWLKLPPRDSLKLFATALAALEAIGAPAPAQQLALIRGWNTTTLLVKEAPFTADELAAVREFAAARWFDLAYLPGLERSAANRWNLLPEPSFYDATMALAGPGRDDFFARYRFAIAPASDDRPYFFDFFSWRALPELRGLLAQGGAGLFEWGYPILLATLLQVTLLGLLLILLPLWIGGPRLTAVPERWYVAGYFILLGLAFLFLEIAFIQRFVLFLGHPLYAVAVVIAGVLLFAGLGSALAEPLATQAAARRWRRLLPIDLAAGTIVLLALTYLLALPPLFRALMALPDAAKIAIALVLLAPLAFVMGLPFPLGLARLSAQRPPLVPWAWGVSGCASVVSALLATLLAVHFGFAVVVVIAVALYLAAAVTFRRAFAVAA